MKNIAGCKRICKIDARKCEKQVAALPKNNNFLEEYNNSEEPNDLYNNYNVFL